MSICKYCGDTLPDGAYYCIECGRAVIATTGATERLAMTGATTRLSDHIVTGSIDAAGLMGLIQYATEYGLGDQIVIAIHYRDIQTVSMLTEFIAVPNWHIPLSAKIGPETYYDRLLGIYREAEIWVKPWAIQGCVSIDVCVSEEAC